MRLDDRYEQHGPLAAGGMATVYLGRTKGTEGFSRLVAIKRLHAQFAADPAFVRMLLDEARVAARIHHANVVPILDVVEADDGPAIVMEYVEGASLAELLARGPLVPLPIAAAVVTGIGHALAAAHEATDAAGQRLDLVHRDVSPHNVLVGSDGTVRLLDFGIAKAIGRAQTTREGQRKGKLAYMAPEQIQEGTASPRSDLWATGVVLWEMLAGKPAFTAENEGAVLHAILTRDLPRPSDVRPPPSDPAEDARLAALEEVALRATLRAPHRRPADAQELVAAVGRAVPPAPPAEVAQWVETLASDLLAERRARAHAVERAATPGAPPSRRVLGWLGGVGVGVAAIAVAVVIARGRTPETVAGGASTASGGGVVSTATAPPSATLASTSAPVPSTSASPPAGPVPVASVPSVSKAAATIPSPPPAAPKPSTAPSPGGVPPPKPKNCDPPYTIGPDGAKIFRPECFP